jgi:Pyruvate/2-oxoacid:ferredoxin oxidoreductase delta subunit
MVNHYGAVTLVDFDKAVKTDGCCLYCPDLQMMEALQENMDKNGGRYGYDASLCM